MKEIKPNSKDQTPIGKTVFLAGSIEMGKAIDWQKNMIDSFGGNNTFFNPRRDDWDNSWKQTLEDENFCNQVNWELDHLEDADIIFFYIDPKTTSPVTLIEFGIHVKSNPEKIICCCPDGFYRKGNLQITGKKYGVEILNTLDEAKIALYKKLK